MKEKEDIQSIRDQHTNGLGVQYLLALKNKLILDELREIQPKLKQDTPQHIIDLFHYISDTAKRDVILGLSKIYDRPSERNNKLRNINKFICQLQRHKIEIFNTIDLIGDSWNNFLNKHSKIINKYPLLNTKKENFIDFIQEIVTNLETKNHTIDRLRVWRDKYLAHNENYSDEVKLSIEEVETLFEITYLIIDFSNSFFNINTVLIEKPNIGFIKEVFMNYIDISSSQINFA